MKQIIWDEIGLSDQIGKLRISQIEDETIRSAILIFPGGGYVGYSDSDCEKIPLWYLERGYRPFVCLYGVKPHAHYPTPLLEASESIWYIRSHHEELHIDPDRIVAAGFSAGAHVAIMIANLWDKDVSRTGLNIPYGGNRPDATMTGYTPTEFETLASKFPDDPQSPDHVTGLPGSGFEEVRSLTVTDYISENTPPAFLWKTSADYPDSTSEYYRQCKKYKVDCEIHIFSDDKNGVGMHFDKELYPDVKEDEYSLNTMMWPIMSLNWLERQWKKKK